MVLTFFSTNGTDTTSSIWDTIIKKFLRLVAVYNQCKEAANGARPSLSNLTTALIQSKVQAEGAEGATNKLSLSMLLLRARAILLNAALSAGIGFALSWITKKFVEYSQRIDTAATKSKEAADAAQSTTSSLKDLVSAYEELGDKSGWDTEDFDQAKDIQAEILDLAKEQRTLDENKLGKLDLQNGKYEEQLGLLQDITAEQLEASRYELTQNKDAQGDKLVDTAKKNNRTHYLTVWSAPEMDMGDQIKNAGIDIFNKFGGYGPDKLNDADSIVDYYNEVGKALKYVIDNTTEAERAAGGTYHSLYQFLLDEQSALRDDVDSYNDSTDAINNNTNARRKLQAIDFWQNDNNNNNMDYLVGLGTDLERVNTELDKYQTNWSTLKDAMDEWNTTGQLTQDTMQKLQELPEEFSNLLTYDEDGNAKIDVKALRQSYVDKLSAFAKEFEGSPIGIQVQAMIDDVREPTHEEYVKLAEKTATYQKVLAQYTNKMSAIDSNKDLSEDEALKQKAEVQKELDDALEKALLEVQETDAQVTTKLKKHWDGVEKVIEEFKSALSDAKAVLSSFLSLLSTLNDKSNNDLKIWGDTMNKVIDKRIKALNKQKEALEENNDATERAIELSRAQDALARAQQQRTTRVYTENGYEWQANVEDVRTAREDLADKKREWNKKDAEKAIDDQIKKYNEFKDKLSEVMDDIGKSWKDYQKELEYTAQIQKMTITQMEGSLDGYHNKIIASLNTGSAITGIQNLIANLESLINTLTKVNNLYSWAKTGEYKDLGTKGLWNTIKGFFNKGGEEAAAESGKTVETFFEKLSSKVQTSGNGLIEKVSGVWKAIKAGAHETFSGSGGGIVSTVIDGFKAIGGAVSKSKVGSALIKGAGKLVAGAGGLIKGAASAIGAAGASAIPVVGAVAATAGLAIYGTAKNYKHQKEIWSNKEDGFGKKAIKSVATFIWDTSPIGAVVNLCKDIFGKSKETAENTKDTANSSSETAENTKKATGVTNLTINATQGTISEENKTEPVEEKKQSKWDKFWGSKFWFWNWGKKASGDKKIKHGGTYNVDEAGPEMLVRQPASGRYTYLETGDGVVPADITSRLFEMGGNPDKWFSDQLAKNGSASMVQSHSSGGISLSIGDVNVNNPVGDSDALASELVNRLPNRIVQQLNKR